MLRQATSASQARSKAVFPAIAEKQFVAEKTPLPVEYRLAGDKTQTLRVLRQRSGGIRHEGDLYFLSIGLSFHNCSRK